MSCFLSAGKVNRNTAPLGESHGEKRSAAAHPRSLRDFALRMTRQAAPRVILRDMLLALLLRQPSTRPVNMTVVFISSSSYF